MEQRKLLHWVNSLPPPACLLVSDLRDLRFGDVLLAVVRCVGGDGANSITTGSNTRNNDDEDEDPSESDARSAALERLRRVLNFVAREARSEDRDALFLVNEAQCAERLWCGDPEAFCAVLRVLKRVGDAHAASERVALSACAEGERTQMTKDVVAALTTMRPWMHEVKRTTMDAVIPLGDNDGVRSDGGQQLGTTVHGVMRKKAAELNDACGNNHEQQPGQRRTVVVGLRMRSALKPKTSPSRHCDANAFREPKVPMRRDDRGQLHVYSMVDPVANRLAGGVQKQTNVACEVHSARLDLGARSVEPARRVRDWMASLGIALGNDHSSSRQNSQRPAKTTREAFEDGVVLCRLAAAVATKFGSDDDRDELHTYANGSVSMPRGSTLHPQSAADKRSNIVVAAGVLTKFCDRGCEASCKGTYAKLVSLLSARKSPRGGEYVWELLDRIRVGVEGSAPPTITTSDSKPKTPRKAHITKCTEDAVTQDCKFKDDGAGDENTSAECNTVMRLVLLPCGKRRPHITSEQMQTLNRWLASAGIDIHEV